MRLWVATCLTVALTSTGTWLLLDQWLAKQMGLRRQVWLTSDFQGVPFSIDVDLGATLTFLEDDPRLPRRFFSARWEGYWYTPSSQFVTLRVDADDYAEIWIDGELRFAGSMTPEQGIRLDAGFHELRIDYQQYGGALHLSLQAGRAGVYPLPLGTEYLFPDAPTPATLRLLTVSAWLRNAAGVTWALGVLAAALLVPFPRRYDPAALTALCLVMLVYGYGNLSLRQSETDSLDNLTLGLRLAQEGVFQLRRGQVGDHLYEPFGPSLLAITHRIGEAIGRGAVPSECVSDETVVRTDYCGQAYVPHRALNVALLLAGALGVFWLVFRLTGVRALAYLGFLMTAQSAALLDKADSFLTEVHAAALIVAVAALSWTTATARRLLYAALLGLALAALVLTKTIFVYLWMPIALMLVTADWLRRRLDWTTAGLVGVLFAAHAIPVSGWMVRNYLATDDFSIVEARSAPVLGYRSSYNTMRHDEWAAGFAYYLPLTRANLQSLGAVAKVGFAWIDRTDPLY